MAKNKKKKEQQALDLEAFLKEIVASAEEREVQAVHNLVTQGLKIKIGSQVFNAKKLAEEGDLASAGFEIDEKAITAGIRWCAHNGTYATPEEVTEIKKELDEIRDQQQGRTSKISLAVNNG